MQFTVIEVANGDYGDFVQQLATAANRSTIYHTDKSGDDSSTPVINVNTLGCIDAPLLKKQLSIDGSGNDAITVPSEWSKFWTLVRRCHVHYYRDWVCVAFGYGVPGAVRVKKPYNYIRPFDSPSIVDRDTFEVDAAYTVCDIDWPAVRGFWFECE